LHLPSDIQLSRDLCALQAIAFLYEDDKEIDAVHFAIALTYYGLLRVPDARTQSETEICKRREAIYRLSRVPEYIALVYDSHWQSGFDTVDCQQLHVCFGRSS
jgi:hypothetical protein